MLKYLNDTLKKKKDKIHFTLLILTTLLPATLLMPTLILNAWTIIISIIFIFTCT